MSVVGQPDVVLGYEKLQAEFSKPSEKIGVTLPQASERVSKAEIPNNLKLLFKHHCTNLLEVNLTIRLAKITT